MKLHALLDRARTKRPITRPIKLRLVALNDKAQATATDLEEAVLVFVSDRERHEAAVEAAQDVEKRYGSKPVPSDVSRGISAYHMLARALRDKDDPAVPFASSPAELETALVAEQAIRIEAEYQSFVEEEFPAQVNDEDFEAMVKEAEGNSLRDLLTSRGYSAIRAALPSLAGRFGASLTRT